MDKSKRGLTIGPKMYMFIVLSLLVAVAGTAGVAYYISATQTDRLYKETAESTAATVASLVDPDFISRYQKTVESDEFQELRLRALNEQDESLVAEYFEKAGLLDQLIETGDMLKCFSGNAKGVANVYIISVESGTREYMYLISDAGEEWPLYYTGLVDEVDEEFGDVNPHEPVDAVISNSDWGWLCSAYHPIVVDGNKACYIGCDVSMDTVMSERFGFLAYVVVGGLVLVSIVLALAVRFAKRTVIRPLNALTKQMEGFKPAEHVSYEEAGVVSLDIRSNDEIQDIYEGIRSMQTDIIDYLNHMSTLTSANERAQNDIREKEKTIVEIHKDAYTDALTSVGSASAYQKMVDELNGQMVDGGPEFAVLMLDINNLKMVNDKCGHGPGDQYIQGCCRLLCDELSHSPVFRIGGDEFVAILVGRDYEDRQEHVARLEDAFAKAHANTAAELWERYSASMGMAERVAEDDSYESVFKRADVAMYQAKEAFKKANGRYR